MADLIDKQKELEPNLGNNGSICTKTGANDEDRTTGDIISRKMAIELIEYGVETLKIALDSLDVTYNEREKFSWGLGLLESYIEDIKELPSEQPETPCYLDSPCEYQNKDIKLPSAQQDDRLNKIAELVDGTIDHFDRDDAMDLLYQIKEVLK